jgi:hypothetical protein
MPESSQMNNYLPHFNGKVVEIRHMEYDFLDALLELTDNSAAKTCLSTNISVILHECKEKRLMCISVIDNGKGMDLNSLRESFIFNLLKTRAEGDIGKFHVGMKYAAIVIGSDITILTRRNGKTVGLWADIDKMVGLDSFSPTELCDDVTDEWALRHVYKEDYNRFVSSDSGTLISISRLEKKCKGLLSKVISDLQKCLPNSYINLYNDCILQLFHNDALVFTITPNNLFYFGEEAKLDTDHKDHNKPLVYSTELLIYKDIEGNERIIEVNTNSRANYNKDFARKNITNGTSKRPLYYEIKPKRAKNNQLSADLVEIPIDSLPDEGTKVGGVKLRFIQVSAEYFKAERDLFPEGSKLQGDRKGFFFMRDIRLVGSGKQLGAKFGDRVTMAGERQRCLVTFSSESDSLVGSKYNKQMSEHALPSKVLNDSMLSIWKQVTNNWTKLYPGKPKAEVSSDDEEAIEEVSTGNSILNILSHTSKSTTQKKEAKVSKLEIGDMQEQIVDEQEQIVDSQGQVAEIQEPVVTNQEQVVDIQEQVVDIQEQVVDIQEQVVDIQEQVVTNQGQQIIENQEEDAETDSEESDILPGEKDMLAEIIVSALPIDTNLVSLTPVIKPDNYSIKLDGSNISVHNNSQSYIIENLSNPTKLFDWVESEKQTPAIYEFIIKSLLSSLYNYQEFEKHC